MGFKTEISKFLIPFLFKQGFSNFPVCGINLIMYVVISLRSWSSSTPPFLSFFTPLSTVQIEKRGYFGFMVSSSWGAR